MNTKQRIEGGRNEDEVDPEAEYYTAMELAKLWKVCLMTVRRLQERRELPFHKVGDCVRFSKSDVLAYLEKHRVDAVDG